MSEQFPKAEIPEKKMTKEEFLQLSQELSTRHERFAFEGLDDESYAMLKSVEEECPGYTTPIDELLKRFSELGIKVKMGEGPDTNVYILPMDSDDIGMDSVFPRHLEVTEGMDPELKKLVLAQKEMKKSKG